MKALHCIRFGDGYAEPVKQLVQRCSRRPTHTHSETTSSAVSIKPTVLYCTNAKVDKMNNRELGSLKDSARCFKATDTIEVLHDALNRSRAKAQLWSCDSRAVQTLSLKAGAQVMLIQNEPPTKQNVGQEPLVNGSRGVVIRFDRKGWPVVRFANGREKQIKPTNFVTTIYGVGSFCRSQVTLPLPPHPHPSHHTPSPSSPPSPLITHYRRHHHHHHSSHTIAVITTHHTPSPSSP